MTFEKPEIPLSEIVPEPEIKKPDGLTHKIFEMGAGGGERLKKALRVLTLAVVLSPVSGETAQADWFKKPQKKETVAERTLDLNNPKDREELIKTRILTLSDQQPEKQREILPFTEEKLKEFFNQIKNFENEVGREANLGYHPGEFYSPQARKFLNEVKNLRSEFLYLFPGSGERKGNKKDSQNLREEFQKLQGEWFKIITGPDYKKELIPDNDELAGGWIKLQQEEKLFKLEERRIILEQERMAYQYAIWRELLRSSNFRCETYVIVPRIMLNNQDRQFIIQMRQTRTIAAGKLFGIMGKYDSNFSDYWLMTGNMLDQGRDYFGNNLSPQQLKNARANYIRSLYYIAGELCR